MNLSRSLRLSNRVPLRVFKDSTTCPRAVDLVTRLCPLSYLFPIGRIGFAAPGRRGRTCSRRIRRRYAHRACILRNTAWSAPPLCRPWGAANEEVPEPGATGSGGASMPPEVRPGAGEPKAGGAGARPTANRRSTARPGLGDELLQAGAVDRVGAHGWPPSILRAGFADGGLADGGPAARAPGGARAGKTSATGLAAGAWCGSADGRAHSQAAQVATGDWSVITVTWSRERREKARHKATSSQLSQVPWSSPVSSSTTVYCGG